MLDEGPMIGFIVSYGQVLWGAWHLLLEKRGTGTCSLQLRFQRTQVWGATPFVQICSPSFDQRLYNISNSQAKKQRNFRQIIQATQRPEGRRKQAGSGVPGVSRQLQKRVREMRCKEMILEKGHIL